MSRLSDAEQMLHTSEKLFEFAADYERMAEQYPFSRDRLLTEARKARRDAQFFAEWAERTRESEAA